MSDESAIGPGAPEISALPSITFQAPGHKLDLVTPTGLFMSVAVIALAIWLGQSNAQFLNTESFLIVIMGTIFATTVSFTGSEIKKSRLIFSKVFFAPHQDNKTLARNLVALSVIAKKKGILALMNYEKQLEKNDFLYRAVQLVVDGYPPKEIDHILRTEIDSLKDRHGRAAEVSKRAAEVAPAMGLIGTLVGLVQMLADLENPETIGPAMAVALLTTFYGAILGTVIMAPLSTKLEKYSDEESLSMGLIKETALSIARQENPRRLEMALNAELPPQSRIRYFD